MTLEQLFDQPADYLASLTDAELEEHFKPYFPTTRPELAAIKRASDGVAKKKAKGGGGLGEALAMEFLAKHGLKFKV